MSKSFTVSPPLKNHNPKRAKREQNPLPPKTAPISSQNETRTSARTRLVDPRRTGARNPPHASNVNQRLIGCAKRGSKQARATRSREARENNKRRERTKQERNGLMAEERCALSAIFSFGFKFEAGKQFALSSLETSQRHAH